MTWFGASAAALLAVFVLYRVGYGSLASGLAIQGVVWLLVYVALIGFATFAVLRGFAVLRDHKGSPFRRGVYVFPVGLIDARSPTLRLYPSRISANVVGPDAAGFTLDFNGKSFVFPVKDCAQAETAKSELASARGKIEEADAARESIRPKALAALDPLQGYANPLVSSEPMVRTAPPWATFAWAFALVTGLCSESRRRTVHNAKSDDACTPTPSPQDDGAATGLPREGSRHEAEVSSCSSPAPSCTTRRRSARSRPSSVRQGASADDIGPEIDTALKAALTKELDVAMQRGDARRHRRLYAPPPAEPPRPGSEERAARGLPGGVDRYAQLAPAKATAETTFMHAPPRRGRRRRVRRSSCRFHRVESKTMDKADTAVQKHRLYKGVVSLPSRYFDAAHEKPWRTRSQPPSCSASRASSPTEIVALAVGEPIADPAAPLPAQITVPTCSSSMAPRGAARS